MSRDGDHFCELLHHEGTKPIVTLTVSDSDSDVIARWEMSAFFNIGNTDLLSIEM
jgi:DNA-binding response OmpR family regulator